MNSWMKANTAFITGGGFVQHVTLKNKSPQVS
jgi:hypothetical protein